MSKKPFVTCVDNGMMVAREDAYYVPSKRRYFSSKEAYERWAKPDPYWNKTIGELVSLVDYPSDLKLPGSVLKRLQDDYKGIGFEAVYTALIEKKKEIDYRMQINTFDNYTKKMNYVLAMIRDDIPVIVKKLRYEKSKEVKEKDNIVDGFDFNEGEVTVDNHKGGVRDLSSLIG